MADITIPYSSNFVAGGDETSEVLDDLLRNQTNTYAWLTSLRRQQYSATPPSNPNTGDVWRCSTTGGGYEANKTYRYSGTAWEEDSVSSLNIPTRNTVIQGPVDISGNLTLFAGGSGLACDLSECIVTWMGGNNGTVGAIDFVAEIPATANFWSGLPQDSTINLYIDFNDTTDTASGSYSTIAPVYQNYAPSHSAGKHWLDYNKGQVWESNGSDWTQKYRVFVGTATTNTLGVTGVSVYPYNVLRQDVEGNASTATVLETTRTINGVSFNGSANIFTGKWELDKLIIRVTSDTAIDVDATKEYYFNSVVNLTLSTSTTGANALDQGTVGNSKWYEVLLIAKTDGTLAGLLVEEANIASPVLPTDYTLSRHLGWVRTHNDGTLLRTLQCGKRTRYIVTPATNTAALPIMASGSTGSYGAAGTAVAVSNFVPSTATGVKVRLYSVAGSLTAVAPSSNYTMISSFNGTTSTRATTNFPKDNTQIMDVEISLESTNVYWFSSGASNAIDCVGWEE
jgi:hypothetical protein